MKIKWTPVKRFLPGSSAWYGSVANKPPPAIVDCVFWYFAKKVSTSQMIRVWSVFFPSVIFWECLGLRVSYRMSMGLWHTTYKTERIRGQCELETWYSATCQRSNKLLEKNLESKHGHFQQQYNISSPQSWLLPVFQEGGKGAKNTQNIWIWNFFLRVKGKKNLGFLVDRGW